MPRFQASLRAAFALGLALVLAGCGLHRANTAYDEGRYEEALAQYREVLKSDPTNVKARIGFQRAKARAAEQYLAQARDAERRGFDDKVIYDILRKAVVLDSDNQAAGDWFLALDAKIKAQADADSAEMSVDAIKSQIEGQPAIQIEPRNPAPIVLNFSSRTSLREILNTLSRSAGVNIMLHTSYQDQSVSVNLSNISFQKALDTLMMQNDMFYRVMDKNTLMIFKNTQQNREQFDNVIIKTYYLSYAEPEPIRGYLVAINPLLKIFADKRMSSISVRAKREELAVVDRIITQLDKPKAEVMVYLELMEVTQSSLEKVGLLPVLGPTDTSGTYRIGATVDATATGNQISWWPKGNRPTQANIKFLVPSLALDALKTDGDARLVASPNVRAISGEKATVNIGDKVSTTQSAISLPTSGTGGSTSLPGGVGQTTYGYENAGVKIEVEPRVHYNGEISLKLKADISTLKASSNPDRPNLGQRTIETTARLRDGETAIFGGLLKDEEQRSLQGLWGLSDMPVLKYLFGNSNRNRAKTDVILTVRAVVVRKPNLTAIDLAPYNPDEATADSGPFAPTKPKTKADAKAEKKPTSNAPAQATPNAPLKPKAGDIQDGPKPESSPAAPPPVQEKTAAPTDAQRAPQASDLVIYVSPVVQQIKKGEKAQLNFLVSGGQGLSGGNLDIRVSPNLKLTSCTSGDFVSGDGSVEQKPGSDGTVKVVFKRNPAGPDSGTLVVMELEGTGAGNGTVTIQGGTFTAGTTPVGGRWVNALITVE